MCGIVGYTGRGNAVEKLIRGLSRLEYRGYDSVGISCFDSYKKINTKKTQGRLVELQELLFKEPLSSHCGIGHTRWATHGVPSDINAHPHTTEMLSLVHNGIIENYSELKEELSVNGYDFVSQTDTEVAAKLLDLYYKNENDPILAIRRVMDLLHGSYAFGIMFFDRPGVIYTVKYGSSVVVAVGEDGNFIASDILAFLNYTDKYFYLEDGEIAQISEHSIEVFDKDGCHIDKNILKADFLPSVAELCGYSHFMEKEIYEQSDVILKTVNNVRKMDISTFFSQTMIGEKKGNIHIVACGTAMHAGLVGKWLIEKWARISVNVWVASEFRYSDPIIGKNDTVVLISQSGETADTLAGLRLAKESGVHTVAVVNVRGSSIARESDSVIYTGAGQEMAVASTKAYMAQLAVMYTFALCLAEQMGMMTRREVEKKLDILERDVPRAVNDVVSGSDKIKEIAREISDGDNMFFIGRGIDHAIALEGSLKLKEITYIHSEGLAAGELKHGTISLISDGVPVVGLITVSTLSDKTVNNIKEVRARGADTVLVLGDGIDIPGDVSERVIKLPPPGEEFSSFAAVAFMQLLAYHAAVIRGCDVDRPRNLAKSVTVE